MITATAGAEANPIRVIKGSKFGLPVVTLSQFDFDTACADLIRHAATKFEPDMIVGIRTGGLVAAESMSRAVSTPLPVFPVTSRRASTDAKARLPLFRTVLSALPRPLVDRLRQVEYRVLTASRVRRLPEQWVDRHEVGRVADHCGKSQTPSRLLVVDDAVDSGATLAAVLGTLRELCPNDVVIRSAAITQTLADPFVRPDYVLFHQTLCRFPWSFDA